MNLAPRHTHLLDVVRQFLPPGSTPPDADDHGGWQAQQPAPPAPEAEEEKTPEISYDEFRKTVLLVGTATTGHGARPATTLARAPSIPATAMMAR